MAGLALSGELEELEELEGVIGAGVRGYQTTLSH